MMDHTFKIPGEVSVAAFRAYLQSYDQWIESAHKGGAKQIVFDFRDCKFICPVAVAHLASQGDILSQLGFRVIAKIAPGGVLRFLQALDLVSRKQDLSNILDKYAVGVQRVTGLADLGPAVEKLTSLVMARCRCSGDTRASLLWALGELIDNAGVHGYGCYGLEQKQYPHPVYICAFSYSNRVEMAILDHGAGIHGTLAIKYPKMSPREALERSIVNGVSGHPEGSPGFGLFGVSELARRGGGQLNIWSSNYGLSVNKAGTKSISETPHKGTIISLSLNQEMEVPFKDIMGRGIEEVSDGLWS